MNPVHFSSNSDEWYTPNSVYSWFMEHGYFDPCPKNHVLNGLDIPWKEKNFVNPPYSQLKSWVKKALFERNFNNRYSVLLIPARTCTTAFKLLYEAGVQFVFICGRMHFSGSKDGAPFPSVYVVLNPDLYQLTMDYIDHDVCEFKEYFHD